MPEKPPDWRTHGAETIGRDLWENERAALSEIVIKHGSLEKLLSDRSRVTWLERRRTDLERP